jgi:molecular chaperone HtpG
MKFECNEFLPNWLHFVKGVIAFEDLPLNFLLSASHDVMHQNKIHRGIRKNLVKNCLDIFSDIAEKKHDYKQFYEQFGMCLEFGFQDEVTNRTKVAELLRFYTSKSGDQKISLHEYVDRMQEGQKDIVYITRASIAAVSSSPILAALGKKGLGDPLYA